MNERLGKWAAVVAFLVTLLVSGAVFGEDPGPCHEAYLQSGLTQQQMTYDDFRQLYADSLCTSDGGGLAATHADRVSGETR